jgi:hypothetical protein
MELNIQEVHYYNELSNTFKAEPILCPYDDNSFSHILLTKIDGEEKVYFKCITCDTKFYPGINLIKKIKEYIKTSL